MATPFRLAGPAALLSPLPLGECLRRLGESVDQGLFGAGNRPLRGRLAGPILRGTQRKWYNNSLQTYLTATLVEEGDATRIACRFGLRPSASIWLVACTALLIAFFADVTSSASTSNIGLGAALAVLAFFLGMVAIGRWLARSEREWLIAFLCETLEARRLSP